jgi:hypothetical protein
MRAKNSRLWLITPGSTEDVAGIKTTLTQVDELEIDFIFSIALLLPGY